MAILMLVQFIDACIMLLFSELYISPLKLENLDDSQLRVELFFLFNGFGLI